LLTGTKSNRLGRCNVEQIGSKSARIAPGAARIRFRSQPRRQSTATQIDTISYFTNID
jgi:hypothetical protein